MWVLLLPLVSILAMVVYDVFDSMFSPLAQWLDGAVLEIDEDSLSNYMDNSEYEWGHNIKGYQHEQLNTKNKTNMETKVCSKCNKELPADAFYKSNRKGGLDSYCKECRLQYNAERREVRKRAAKTQEAKVEAPKPAETHPGEHHLHKIYYNKDLAKYPPRELMMELKARGYVGELMYTETIIKEHRINLARLN